MSFLPIWFQAGFWGLIAGSALLLGATVGYFARLPQRIIAWIMAFGGGVLISALAFDLMDEAYARGGFDSTALVLLEVRRFTLQRIGFFHERAPNTGNAPGNSNLPKSNPKAAD